MTKNELQKELKEKVREGIKPSQLKRSKSLGDVAAASPNIPLKRSTSQPAFQPPESQQITQLKQDLAFWQEKAKNYLASLQKTAAELDQKELRIKELEKQLDSVNKDWLALAHKNTIHLKEWQAQQTKIKELSTELEQTIADATEEINQQETDGKQLRAKLSQARQQIINLNRQLRTVKGDLDLHQRAAEFRVNKPVKNGYWDYAPIIAVLGLYCLAVWLFGRRRYD